MADLIPWCRPSYGRFQTERTPCELWPHCSGLCPSGPAVRSEPISGAVGRSCIRRKSWHFLVTPCRMASRQQPRSCMGDDPRQNSTTAMAACIGGLPIRDPRDFIATTTGVMPSESHLLKPPLHWDLMSVWDPDAEKLRGIALDDSTPMGVRRPRSPGG